MQRKSTRRIAIIRSATSTLLTLLIFESQIFAGKPPANSTAARTAAMPRVTAQSDDGVVLLFLRYPEESLADRPCGSVWATSSGWMAVTKSRRSPRPGETPRPPRRTVATNRGTPGRSKPVSIIQFQSRPAASPWREREPAGFK